MFFLVNKKGVFLKVFLRVFLKHLKITLFLTCLWNLNQTDPCFLPTAIKHAKVPPFRFFLRTQRFGWGNREGDVMVGKAVQRPKSTQSTDRFPL